MKYATLIVLLCLLVSCNKGHNADDSLIRSILTKYPIAKNGNKNELLFFVKESDSVLSVYKNPVHSGLNNFIKGSYFTTTANYQLAQKYLSQAGRDLSAYPAYDSLRFASYLFLSEVFSNMGDFDESMRQSLKAISGYEKLHSDAGMYASRLAMARMFQMKGDIKKSKEILRVNTFSKDTIFRLRAMHVLANIYGEQGELDSALAIDNEVLSGREMYPDNFVSPFLNNKSLCLSELKQFDSALYYFKQSILIDSTLGNLQNMAANYSDLGGMYLSKKDFGTAKFYNLHALSINRNIGKKVVTLFSYKNLYELYKLTDDLPQALLYGDSVATLQKELDNVAVNTGIEELNLEYETSKKEKTILEQQETIFKNKILLTGIGVSIIIFALFIFSNNRKRALKQQLEKVRQQQENERAVADAENKERQRISRDLHDNMGAYTSALLANIEKLKIKKFQAPELDKMQDTAGKILSSLRETIWILNNKEVSVTDFNDGFKNYCFKIFQNFENIDFNVEETISCNKNMPAATAIHLNKILQEVIQNSIKHSNAAAINYRIHCDGKFEIQLHDSGNGFDMQTIKRGNGLDNMEWRAAQAGIDLSFDSNLHSGTTVIMKEL